MVNRVKAYGRAVVGVAAVALVAGAVALGAAAWAGEECESFPDGLDSTVEHSVCGPILERYRAEGGPAKLGLPLSDEGPVTLESAKPYGDRQVSFAQGTIYLERGTGRTALGQWFSYSPHRGETPKPTRADRDSGGRIG